jgi:hypothetical protein
MSKTVWREDIANAPHDQTLLLITKPHMLDAATEHVYDILVGYRRAATIILSPRPPKWPS